MYTLEGESHEKLISRVSIILGEDLEDSGIEYVLFHGTDLVPNLPDRETKLIVRYLTRCN